MIDARPLIEQFLAKDDLEALALAVATPYKACADFMGSNVVTSSFPIGIEQKPHLLRAFIDHSLMRMADSRAGFNHEMKWNVAHNCMHIRVFKGRCAMTAHFMGRKNFRTSARHAENREILAMRNGDLFAYEGSEMDDFANNGYVQILHGGNASPEFLMLVIPTHDQSRIGAGMELKIPAVDAAAAEVIREEMILKLKTQDAGAAQDGNQAAG